eukprot:m.456359 g.456359  ORF g.456359 m.456359 type:complete len:648 (-) comp21045_c0_seq1:130-2073(-)
MSRSVPRCRPSSALPRATLLASTALMTLCFAVSGQAQSPTASGASANNDDEEERVNEPNAVVTPKLDLIAVLIIVDVAVMSLAFVYTSLSAWHYRQLRLSLHKTEKTKESDDGFAGLNDAMKGMLQPARNQAMRRADTSIYLNADSVLEGVFVDANQVKLGAVLGEGEFGEVRAGIFNPGGTASAKHVAVKTIKGGEIANGHLESFQQEMQIMAQLAHNNILRTLAVVPNPLMIVMELASTNIKDYIHKRGYSHTNPLPWPTLLAFVSDTCSGMRYLAERNVIHRDIAARNMLLHIETRAKFVCKVADFGLSKVVAQQRFLDSDALPIPTRWTAPEALLGGLWSEKSDVWSWGVMVWELTTHGQFPYTVINADSFVVELVREGLRLHQNAFVPNELYGLLENCWRDDPCDRPDFNAIAKVLQDLTTQLTDMNGDDNVFASIPFKTIEAECDHKLDRQDLMEFTLPAAPVFTELTDNTSLWERFFEIVIDKNEDSCFMAVSSPFIGNISLKTNIVRKRYEAARIVRLAIGPEDLLPRSVRYVRRISVNIDASPGDTDVLYSLPKRSRRPRRRSVFANTAESKSKVADSILVRPHTPEGGDMMKTSTLFRRGPKRRGSIPTILSDEPSHHFADIVNPTALHIQPPRKTE